MTSFNKDRRKVLAAGGSALAIALAGCSAFADGRGVPGGAEPPEDEDEQEDDWLDGVGNWDGEAVDLRGEEEIEIENGEVEGIDQTFVYEPADVHIDPGTEVTWVWRGSSGHTVTDRDGAFDSGNIRGDGETWSHTFEDDGVYEYYCEPHRGQNQKGRVLVGDAVDPTEEVDEHLDGVENYDGEIVDYSEDDDPVLNGEVDGAGQDFAFEPAAIRVEEGTEVTWEWAGDVGHTVTHIGDDFDSGNITGDGETWSHTFEESGVYLYECEPHAAQNQLGAVIVE